MMNLHLGKGQHSMEESPSAYIPMDRRQAIAKGEGLPNRTDGAALFADISGFTPLTEALLRAYGPGRGAEELTRQLNLIYDALVTEVHRYGGSVLAFSGDAITCWLDGDSGLQATACGLAMQRAMRQFSAITTPAGDVIPLAMKVAVAIGPVRRFRLGDPQIQYIDALAGDTLNKMAEAEHQAEKGEVVVGPDVIARIGDQLDIVAWREVEPQHRFGVVGGIKRETEAAAPPAGWPPLTAEALVEEQIRPWVLPPIYERLQTGQGQFLAELRPAVVMFLYFSGIDYDDDEAAGDKLDAYIRWVQTVLARYDGYIFQLTIGDKGSYLYTAYGAPTAHEDDAIRAVSTALALQALPAELNFIEEVRIGISQGQMYTGAYGGNKRRTYGLLGDDVNLAARLMQAAQPGQTLVSEAAQRNTHDLFTWEQLPPFKVKGKTNSIVAFQPTGQKSRATMGLHEVHYALPMVGRTQELTFLEEKLSQALAGRGQIVAVTGEAGMGKSRLVAELIHSATNQNMIGYGGECQSYGTNISYLVWQPIWQGFFGLDPAWEIADQISHLERQLEQIDPALGPRLPLLGTVLNLPIPDNELTAAFDAKLRKTSLESLLVDCLRLQAQKTPLLLVLEDMHWLDPLSHDLLEVISRTIVDLPVMLVMAHRPLGLERLQAPRVNQLPHFSEISLTDFTPDEAKRLITLKLEQLTAAQEPVPTPLIERITARAQGNPFYIEELLNYIHDQGLDLHNIEALAQLDLPTSLHSLILSRIDQLSENQKIILKIASVIGRLFKVALLQGMHQDFELDKIEGELEILTNLELTEIDSPKPELAYIFKHIITQEVAYESMPYATRAIQHEKLAQFLERTYRQRLDQYINLLAYHYEHSDNETKKREYLRKAGEAAQADYANQAAIDYYRRVLPLLPPHERVEVMLKLGEVLQLLGQWTEARELYEETLYLTKTLNDGPHQGRCQTAMGELLRKQRLFDESSTWLERARTTFEEIGDQAGVGQVLHYEGTLAWNQGDYEAARSLYEKSLAIRQQLNDKARIADLLSNLGLVAHYQGNLDEARNLYEKSLELRYQLGNKWGIAVSLNNLGYLSIELNDSASARTQLEVAVGLQREVGDRWMIALGLHNLANVARAEKLYDEARQLYEEAIMIDRDLGDREAIAYLLADVGGLAALQGQAERALRLTGAAEAQLEAVGVSLPPAEKATLEGLLAPARQALGEAQTTVLVNQGRAWSLDDAIQRALQAD